MKNFTKAVDKTLIKTNILCICNTKTSNVEFVKLYTYH